MALESCTSLQRNSEVAPKKLPECAFALDIKEHKEIRTYYLAAHSETEKKQWLDAMVASKKYYAVLAANAGPRWPRQRAGKGGGQC